MCHEGERAVANCPFCGKGGLQLSLVRNGHSFHRCVACHAQVQLNPPLKKEWEAYESGEFLGRISEWLGSEPDYERFDEYRPYMVGNSLLEIGPGSGHFLAAAKDNGFRVSGVELSRAHREYILSRWGIEVFGDPIEQDKIPAESFDNIVSFNCLEHIPNPAEHLRGISRAVRPGGCVLISTCNADALAARVVGKWWAMYRVPDHVSIPSKRGLESLGRRAGLIPLRMWSSEYPLETLGSIAVAVRDWWTSKPNHAPDGKVWNPIESQAAAPAVRRIGQRLIRSAIFSPVSKTISAFGAGGSIKVVYKKPKS
jgi:SAM-dependent methyltransferase